MAFNRILSVLFIFLFWMNLCPPVFAEALPDEPSGLGAKSDAELIAAVRELQEKVGKDPSNMDLYLKLSEIYSALFDRTRKKNAQANEWLIKSADALERVVMAKPDHKVALYNLGVVYKRQGKMERAREELRKAARACDPKEDSYLLTAIWLQIGSVYEEQGFFDEAKEAYEKAQDYDYGNEDIRSALLDLKEKKAAAASSAGAYNFTPSMPLGNMGPSTRTYDPMSGADLQPQGLEQVMPALSSMLSQKFSGQQGDQRDNYG